jgi:hypothetical protein
VTQARADRTAGALTALILDVPSSGGTSARACKTIRVLPAASSFHLKQNKSSSPA